jgi:hypothetical protein
MKVESNGGGCGEKDVGINAMAVYNQRCACGDVGPAMLARKITRPLTSNEGGKGVRFPRVEYENAVHSL